MKALSIRQPWAWLVVNGSKDIENREKIINYRGPLLIHAGKLLDDDVIYPVEGRLVITSDFRNLIKEHLPEDLLATFRKSASEWGMGGIVGIANVVDCVQEHQSPWFFGKWGYVLEDRRPLPFTPYRGMPGLFDVPDEIVKQLGL